jgi:hypothetical protein
MLYLLGFAGTALVQETEYLCVENTSVLSNLPEG